MACTGSTRLQNNRFTQIRIGTVKLQLELFWSNTIVFLHPSLRPESASAYLLWTSRPYAFAANQPPAGNSQRHKCQSAMHLTPVGVGLVELRRGGWRRPQLSCGRVLDSNTRSHSNTL